MKKEIIIDGKKSDWYKKAIFVLKDDVKNPPMAYKLSSYADELIESYLKKVPQSRRSKSQITLQRNINLFFYGCILSAIIAVILLGVRIFS